MSNLIKLVQNENMKLFRKPSTLIMLGMLIALIIGMGFLVKFNGHEASTHWKQDTMQQTQMMKTQLEKAKGDQAKSLKEKIAINDYRLDHNITPLSNRSIWGFTSSATDIMQLITVFTIIIAGGMVSSEFGSGTIKLLLTRPVRRSKILLSKYISIFVYAVIFACLALIVSWLVGGIMFGFHDLSYPNLTYTNGAVHEGNMFLHVIAGYGFDFVSLIIMSTVAFMISSVFRNTALAIGLSIFGLMAGALVIQLLAGYSWVKYILFTNLDLSYYFGGNAPLFDGMTLGFSITVLLIYYVIFLIITWLFFTKRDVAA